MKNRLSFLALCILLLPFLPSVARASETTHYSWLARKAGDLSSAKVMQIADRYAANGRHGEALVLYALVYDRFSEDMDDDGKNMCSLARQKAGKVYYDRGDYVEALDEFINGVKLSEQCDKPRYAARIYNHIGNVYCIFLDWEKGLDYYHKAYDLVEKYRDRKTEHDILVNMTGIYTFLEDMPEARKYYRLSERTKDTSDPEDVYMSGFTHSLIRICEGDAMKAIACLKSLAVYAKEKKLDPKYQCFAYQEIYGAYGMAGIPDSTLKYMILCDAVAHRYNLQHTFATTLKSLSEFYEDRGDAVMSNKYKSLYMDIMDSIYNMRRFDAAKNSLFTYEVSKTTREISDLKERENQRLQTIRMQRPWPWWP